MTILKGLLALSLGVLVVPQAWACFTVYNPASQVVYSGMEAPIDMRYQIHERLPAVFPGGHMIFGSSTDCPSVDARQLSPVLSNVTLASAAGVAKPARQSRTISRAARERAQDALTK